VSSEDDDRRDHNPIDAAADMLRRQVIGAISQRMNDSPTRDEVDARLAWMERQFRWRWIVTVALVLVTAWFAVNMHQVFLNVCVQPAYLSRVTATVCDWSFVGDRNFTPGPQVADKPAPSVEHHD